MRNLVLSSPMSDTPHEPYRSHEDDPYLGEVHDHPGSACPHQPLDVRDGGVQRGLVDEGQQEKPEPTSCTAEKIRRAAKRCSKRVNALPHDWCEHDVGGGAKLVDHEGPLFRRDDVDQRGIGQEGRHLYQRWDLKQHGLGGPEPYPEGRCLVERGIPQPSPLNG